MKKRIVLLGSTGSIGENALRVVSHLSAELTVLGLAAGRRADRVSEQAAAFGCNWVYVAEADARSSMKIGLPDGVRVLRNEEALCKAVAHPEVDIVLCAIVGTGGLRPVLSAIRAGKDIALASKEILVMAGELVMAEAERCGVRIISVDSEHSALFQCLEGRRIDHVRRLVLTASGGPFREFTEADLHKVTPEQALAHPTWTMGAKITIDSATMMNKGLELIEARWLFGLQPDSIDVVVHPQSVIHSLVEFVDSSTLAQMSYPDMCVPIQYALTFPERRGGLLEPLDFTKRLDLSFLPPDNARFPAINLAREALSRGGTAPAVYNAANEVAVESFCSKRISFPQIWQTVESVLKKHMPTQKPTLEDILAADDWARQATRSACLGNG